jgi:predicted nucleic acid-binding Zn ribbon protein
MAAPSDRGRWQVQRERCHLDSDTRLYPSFMDGALGEAVPELVRKLGLADTYWEHTLEREWPTLVGEQLARHTRPGRMNRGVLYVYVTSAPWLAELNRMGLKPMLENVQRRFGESRVKSIRLQPDPDPPSRRNVK